MSNTKTMKERLSVIETEVKNTNLRISEMDERFRANIEEIKQLMREHVEWQKKQHEELSRQFANKWVEKVAVGLIISLIATIVGLVLGKL